MNTLRRSRPRKTLRFAPNPRRRGKILVLLALLLPTLGAVAGLTVDAGLLHSSARALQQATDAAATAAAIELKNGHTPAVAIAAAQAMVQQHNGLADATVQVNIPPTSGLYAGSTRHAEVSASRTGNCYFMPIFAGPKSRTLAARAVAGHAASTSGAAIVVLDPDPPPFQLGVVTPLLPALPAILGGLEVLGLGQVEVDGAVLVNNTWGGKDENGLAAGMSPGPPYAVSATPLISLSHLKVRDLYVVGGVDKPANYGPLTGAKSPLVCNRLPVVDPYEDLPVPTTASDATNVRTTNHGGKLVVGLPLIGPPVTLQPGVYDWISVVSGIARFQPGVYIIRGKHPVTQLSLSVVAGKVEAPGVLFYITNNGAYSATTGGTDAADLENDPPYVDVAGLLPSVVMNIGLLGSELSGLNDPTSPFHGMLIYQRRHDRRPIVLVQEALLGAGSFSGTVYSKWGHVILAGLGEYEARFVIGTMRIVALLNLQIRPQELLGPAQDVFLME